VLHGAIRVTHRAIHAVSPLDGRVLIWVAIASSLALMAARAAASSGFHFGLSFRLPVHLIGRNCAGAMRRAARPHDGRRARRPDRAGRVVAHVGKNQKRVKRHEAFGKGDQYTFIALGSSPKAIISYRIGWVHLLPNAVYLSAPVGSRVARFRAKRTILAFQAMARCLNFPLRCP
jgi:hypothetical protein